MENIAKKIKALNYSEEMMAILPKFLGTLAARNPETGEEVITEQELVQTLNYLKEKGISLRPSQLKVLANGFSYIKKSIEEMERIGEIKMYVDDPTRITSKDNVSRILFLRDRKVEYKSPEGKYSKLAYSKRTFESEYGVIDFAAEKAKREQSKQVSNTTEHQEIKKDAAVISKPAKDSVTDNKVMQDKKISQSEANKEASAPISSTKTAVKKEINPEPIKRDSSDSETTRVDIKIPVLDEPKPEKINLAGSENTKAPGNIGPKPESSENRKNNEDKPKNIKPVTPINPQNKNNGVKSSAATNKGEEKVSAVITSDESIEYTGELDLANLEASFNNKAPEEDTLIKNTVINITEGPINVYNTPYDEILSKPQTIALTDETFERYESLSDSIRRVLTTVYNVAEVNDSITDNLIKLVTSGVASDSEVMYYAITYGKNLTEEEAQRLRTSIEEELEYIKIFDLDTEGQGRAA